jgi:hypothetical protein
MRRAALAGPAPAALVAFPAQRRPAITVERLSSRKGGRSAGRMLEASAGIVIGDTMAARAAAGLGKIH